MVVSDEIIIIGIGLIFSYAVLYRKNWLVGNIGYMCCGIALMAFSTGNTASAIGLIVLIGGVISAAIDLITK